MHDLIIDEITYEAYFQGLATSHVDIQSFYFGDEDVVRSAVKADKHIHYMWLHPFDPITLTVQGSNYQDIHPCHVAIYGVPEDKTYAKKREQYSTCLGIVKDIRSRLIKDKGDCLLSATIKNYKIGELEEFQGATQYVGAGLTFDLYLPADIVYNETKFQ